MFLLLAWFVIFQILIQIRTLIYGQIEYLKKNFKKVYWSDPYIKNQIITTKFKYGKKVVKLSGSRLKLFDIVILMTDHDKFNYNMIYKNSKVIIDCRGRYQIDQKVIRT